jgi:hypothetical protein
MDPALAELASVAPKGGSALSWLKHKNEYQQRDNANPGWTTNDPPKHIWDVSISHMGAAVQGFAKGPAEFPFESLMKELVPAQLGFSWLANIEYRSEFSIPFRDALDDWAKGLTFGDNNRASRGYEGTREAVNALIAAGG